MAGKLVLFPSRLSPRDPKLTLDYPACSTAILKTSEMSPRTHMIIAEVLEAAGLPKGVLSIVHVSPSDAAKVVEAFIAHPEVRKVK